MKPAIFLAVVVTLSLNAQTIVAIPVSLTRPTGAAAAVELPRLNNTAFRKGEKLTYRLHYGVVDAGTASIEVMNENKKIAGRDVYHIVGTGKSNRFFDFFFKVRDRYESYVDAQGLFPWSFVRRVDEGGYTINQDYQFQQHRQKVFTQEGKSYDVPSGVHDMISAFYHVRNLDYSRIKKGDVISVNTFIDNEIWPAGMKYLGTDTITVETGTYSCMKFAPVVQKGRIFKQEEDLVVWVTNDRNKIPVLAEAKILVGSIRMDLLSYEGLANPLAKVKL